MIIIDHHNAKMFSKNLSELFKISSSKSNIFDDADKKIKSEKREIYDCGVLDPAKASGIPSFVYEGIEEYIKSYSNCGYPGNKGEEFFISACYDYLKRNFDISLDSSNMINITNGSKTDEFIFSRLLVNPGDTVICPTPGYPSFRQGVAFASGNIHFVPLSKDDGFLLNFKNIPLDIARKAKLIWINYPNSPTGAAANIDWMTELVDWARENEIVIASDEAYIDFAYFHDDVVNVDENFCNELDVQVKEFLSIIFSVDLLNNMKILATKCRKNLSILNITTENVIAFFSLSKRSNLSSFRVGFAAGDEEIISSFYSLKNMHDDGVPHVIQHMASKALMNDEHVEKSRMIYNYCRFIWSYCFNQNIDLNTFDIQGGLFLWIKVPDGINDNEFARILFDVGGISCICGSAFGMNDYIRLALSADLNFVHKVAQNILKTMNSLRK